MSHFAEKGILEIWRGKGISKVKLIVLETGKLEFPDELCGGGGGGWNPQKNL